MFFSVLFCTVRLSIFERFVFASFEPLRFCKKVRFVFPDLDAFSYYDVNRKNFVVDNGEYNIELGFSSRDIKLKDQTQINVVSAIDEAHQDTEKGNLIPSVVKQGEIIRIAQGCASELNIFDLTGQMLLKQIDKCTIDTSYLKKGAYLALYKIDEKFHTGKFIVE